MSDGVLVVGAGHGGVSVAATLRKEGWTGDVTLLDRQDETPHHRPPLSKEALAGDQEPGGSPLRPASFYEKQDVGVRRGVEVSALDLAAREVELDTGERLGYAHLVLACGARTRTLDVPGVDLPGVHELRTAADARALRDGLADAQRVVVVGGGYIGLEVAAAARARGCAVTVLEVADRLLGRVATPDLADHVRGLHDAAGVDVRCEARLERLVAGDDGRVAAARLAGGERVDADLVVVGVGVAPAVELAEAAGLDVDDGVLVDAALRTSDPNVWAIGDVARLRADAGDRRLESVQNATDQGRTAAQSILGADVAYDDVPWFWTVQHGVRVQIAGLLAGGDLRTARRDAGDGGGAFSIGAWSDGTLVAVESVGAPKDHMAARALLAAGASPTPERFADPATDPKALAVDG